MVDAPLPLPPAGPATLAAVKVELGVNDNRDDPRLLSRVAAINATMATWETVVGRARGADDWDAQDLSNLVLGANLLVARLWQRRNSPLGFEAIADQGAVYVSRNDPDVAMLLGIGAYQGPQNMVG